MLLVMEPKTLQNLSRVLYILDKRLIVLNLNANVQCYTRLNLMPPLGMNTSSMEFDTQYINLLLSDPNYFMQFMYIMNYLKNGCDVVLLIYNEDTVFNAITETLVKFIQQRYGYNYQFLNDVEDFNQWDQSSFTAPGIIQFDQDYLRYEEYLMRLDPNRFINEPVIE